MKHHFLQSAFTAMLVVGTFHSDLRAKSPNVPAHKLVSDQKIVSASGKARRIEIEIHAVSDISKEDCIAILNLYVDRAGAGGLVSVHKLNKYGTVSPWCFDNRDGKAASFNEELF